MNELNAEYSFCRRSSVWVWANVTYDALLATLLVIVTSYVVLDTTDPLFRIGAVVMYGIAGIAVSRVLWRLKYWYVTTSVYVVEADGIRLVHLPGSPLVRWDQISEAEYVPVIPAFRLQVMNHQQPIVLFVERSWNPSGRANRRNQLAAQRIGTGLGGRLRKRWLPW